MRTSIVLVRHGQTLFNKQRRYQGSSDMPLTPYGVLQAEAAAARLARAQIRSAIVSPSTRARTTADIILGNRDVQPHDDADWRETAHGRWEGLTYREVQARFPTEALSRFADALHGRATGGESLAEVAERVQRGWRTLLQRNPGGRVLVVTHATPIQLVLCLLMGVPVAQHWRWRIDLGSITMIDIYGGGAITRMINEVPRLAIARPVLEGAAGD